MPHPWQGWRLGWIGLWATTSSGGCPCPRQRGWNWVSEVSSHPGHTLIPRCSKLPAGSGRSCWQSRQGPRAGRGAGADPVPRIPKRCNRRWHLAAALATKNSNSPWLRLLKVQIFMFSFPSGLPPCRPSLACWSSSCWDGFSSAITPPLGQKMPLCLLCKA